MNLSEAMQKTNTKYIWELESMYKEESLQRFSLAKNTLYEMDFSNSIVHCGMSSIILV